MDFIDLKKQQLLIKDDLNSRIMNVLDHGKYIMGPEVRELEQKLADFVGVDYCVGVSSGTDALLIALMAIGIKPGDEVITTPFSFIATAETIELLGAKAIFVDIDQDTYNIDVNKIEDKVSEKTKAIMPVSLYGQCADFDLIDKIAVKYNLKVIEDAAQSFGATYKDKKSCSLSDIGCTSFFPSKPLGCYGDAGACFTNSEELYNLMNSIRIHGQEKRYHHTNLGLNGRIDTIQAAILLSKMEIFENEIILRNQVAKRYKELFTEFCPNVKVPYIKEHNVSVFAQYTLNVDSRDNVLDFLKESDIPTAVHYPVPIHKQPIYQSSNISLPISEKSSSRVMSIPMHPYLEENDQSIIVKKISEAL